MEKIKLKTKLLMILIGITVITVAFYYRYSKNATSSLIISDVNQNHSSLNRYVEIILGGDVSFDLKIRKPRVVIRDYPRNILEKIRDKIYYGRQMIIGHRFPEVLLSDWAGEFTWWEKDNSIAFNFTFSDIKKEMLYPFNKIGDILKHSDISFVNLETPLAMEDECRVIGYFVSKPEFGMAMKKAGIDVVSVANNHVWDAEERGFLQTLENLEKANIKYTGGEEILTKRENLRYLN